MNKVKKFVSILLQILGIIAIIGGVANLFLSFSDKWLMLGGLFAYIVGYLIQEGIETNEYINKPIKK